MPTDNSHFMIFVAPFLNTAAPYVISLVALAITMIIRQVINPFLQAHFGIAISHADMAAIDHDVRTQGGKWVLQAEPGWRDLAINARSKVVADAANQIIGGLPAQIQRTGITPTKVMDMVAGEMGRLQAAAGPTPSAPDPAAVAPPPALPGVAPT